MAHTKDFLIELNKVAALKSAAEAHYANAVTGWALQKVAAGFQPGFGQPSASERRQFLFASYDAVIRNLPESATYANPYKRELERLRDLAIRSVEE